MSVPVFLELVEMKAKTASVFPFLLGVCFSAYYYGHVNVLYAILFFIAMFSFNMAVDCWDNYNDYNHAVDTVDYKKHTNIIGREHLNPRKILAMLLSMAALGAVIGIYLVVKVGLSVLWMGLACYLIGFLYSFGKYPLSSLPVGELASGLAMGVLITFIAVDVSAYQYITWNWRTILQIWLVTLPNELWISNLMLANNICDHGEDERNHRHTIVHFLGIKLSLTAFAIKNILALGVIALSVYLKLAPWTALLTWITIPFVYQQTKMLIHRQVKKETFLCAVKILAVCSFTLVVTYGIGLVL